jgi:hypothetical protein
MAENHVELPYIDIYSHEGEGRGVLEALKKKRKVCADFRESN